MPHSRSFLANQKARNAIVGAENLLMVNIPRDEVNIHEPEANNCFSIITQVIIEIPKQGMLQFYHNLTSYHAAHMNVSRNAFLNSRSEEKNIFFDVYTG